MPRLEARRSRAGGEYVSPDTPTPARGPTEATMFRATLDLPPAQLADTNLVVNVVVEGTIDGTNWIVVARGDGWRGGTVGRDGTIRPPHISWMSSDNRVLTRVRVRWTQSKTASIGASLDTELRVVRAVT